MMPVMYKIEFEYLQNLHTLIQNHLKHLGMGKGGGTRVTRSELFPKELQAIWYGVSVSQIARLHGAIGEYISTDTNCRMKITMETYCHARAAGTNYTLKLHNVHNNVLRLLDKAIKVENILYLRKSARLTYFAEELMKELDKEEQTSDH